MIDLKKDILDKLIEARLPGHLGKDLTKQLVIHSVIFHSCPPICVGSPGDTRSYRTYSGSPCGKN